MPSTAHIRIKKVSVASMNDTEDIIAAEEPLEIRLEYGAENRRMQKSISVTMRTPGNDKELAAGFLFTEGIIKNAAEVKRCINIDENIVQVALNETATPAMDKIDRHFYTTSSCGVCGKSSIESIKTVCPFPVVSDKLLIHSSLIYTLPDKLRQQQAVFESTGGLHGCALFNDKGELLLLREDVGRHNALDKLIGASLYENRLPLDSHILLLSGRASFELVQKATMAGIKIIAAVGAPSTLAVQMAQEAGITLIGFLRGERFNIYTGAQRVVI